MTCARQMYSAFYVSLLIPNSNSRFPLTHFMRNVSLYTFHICVTSTQLIHDDFK